MRSCRFVCHAFCHFVCLSVSRITAKVISRFHWNLVLWSGLPIERTDQLSVVFRSPIRIPDHFSTSLTIAELDILGDLLAFLIRLSADFHDTRQMTDADKVMHTQYFGSDPTDIWTRIPDHFRRYALSGHCLVCKFSHCKMAAATQSPCTWTWLSRLGLQMARYFYVSK